MIQKVQVKVTPVISCLIPAFHVSSPHITLHICTSGGLSERKKEGGRRENSQERKERRGKRERERDRNGTEGQRRVEGRGGGT